MTAHANSLSAFADITADGGEERHQMNWTKEQPVDEGLFLYRESINPAINQLETHWIYTGCVLMKVFYYEDRQSSIPRHLAADPQLPYRWSATPGFIVAHMKGEWLPWSLVKGTQ